MSLPSDALDTTCLTLTVAYYMFHMRQEVEHQWRRALNRWREGQFHNWRALVLGAVALLVGGCVQSGPVLLYLNHLYGKFAGGGVH